MEEYDELLNALSKKIIAEDEQRRRASGLDTDRSQAEGAEYRGRVDSLYESTREAFTNSGSDVPKPVAAMSSLFMARPRTEFRSLLNECLVSPHAACVALNYLTKSNGRHADMGVVCNLYGLSGVFGSLSGATEAARKMFAEPLEHVARAFEALNMDGWQLSKTGLIASAYWNWLIYEPVDSALDLDLLPKLANAAQGNVEKYRAGIVGLWKFKQTIPDGATKAFYKDVLPNVFLLSG